MSYQEEIVGYTIFFVFGLAILLVYFALAGQYESWILPLSVLLVVPLSLLGVVGALMILREDNNLYTQIGLVLLIALSSKNAILIVQYARMQRAAGSEIVGGAVEAARLRFRPIIMTSFAFILGIFPLVIATGAGAASERSIGIAVFAGMIASTGLAVVFLPSFYVVLQRFDERRQRRRAARRGAPPPARPGAGSPPSST
jgi:hydrophobic/amphiphilic exporter-1 (mainly G- bacteria), HAE1 family